MFFETITSLQRNFFQNPSAAVFDFMKISSWIDINSVLSPVVNVVPNLSESLSSAETPFDLMVDYLNFWARNTGIEMIHVVDKVDIFFVNKWWTKTKNRWG